MKAKYILNSMDNILEIYEDRVTIKPKGMESAKEFPFQTIVAIQFIKAGVQTNGFIKFVDGNESRGVLLDATIENTVSFTYRDLPLAIEIKEYIDSAIKKLRWP